LRSKYAKAKSSLYAYNYFQAEDFLPQFLVSPDRSIFLPILRFLRRSCITNHSHWEKQNRSVAI